MTTATKNDPRPKRAQRRDGAATRMVILEAAGRVFAERGFSDATSKEICARANVNNAAVNYYFGGKESLYGEVLVEAHRQMVSLEELDAILASGLPPEEKLRAFLTRLIKTAVSSADHWGIKVFLRELAAPSPGATAAILTAVFPKSQRLRQLVHEVTGLPPDSSQVQRCVAFVVLPCVSLIMFPEKLRTAILPATATVEEGLLEDMMRYALAGLRAFANSVS